jgi:hypothetical protein
VGRRWERVGPARWKTTPSYSVTTSFIPGHTGDPHFSTVFPKHS